MVVGPEAAGSLLVGTVIKSSVDNGKAGEGDDEVRIPFHTHSLLEFSSSRAHCADIPTCRCMLE